MNKALLLSRVGMGAAALGLLASGAGCGLDTGDDAVVSRQAALTSEDFSDSSGLVHIRIKICDWSAPAQHPFATCTVDPDFVLVGGGAEVEGSAGGGGLLTLSSPCNKTTWGAGSADHVVAYAHRVRAYAIGMALSGMSAATLSSQVTITQQLSNPSHAPSAIAQPSGNDVLLLSGGATSNPSGGAGQLLTGSFPAISDTAWEATAKDHQVSDVTTVTAFAISIPRCPAQWTAFKCLRAVSAFQQASSGSGYAEMDVLTPAGGYAPIGIGARAFYNGAGRMLTDLFPTIGPLLNGATTFSKDHNIADPGATAVWARGIRAL
jgi:hypothetical protein